MVAILSKTLFLICFAALFTPTSFRSSDCSFTVSTSLSTLSISGTNSSSTWSSPLKKSGTSSITSLIRSCSSSISPPNTFCFSKWVINDAKYTAASEGSSETSAYFELIHVLFSLEIGSSSWTSPLPSFSSLLLSATSGFSISISSSSSSSRLSSTSSSTGSEGGWGGWEICSNMMSLEVSRSFSNLDTRSLSRLKSLNKGLFFLNQSKYNSTFCRSTYSAK